MTSHRRVKRGAVRWIIASAAITLIAAACGGGGTSNAVVKAGGTFTFAISAQPTLNPYLADTNPYNVWVLSLAYEPLIRQQANLSYGPGLAASFKFTDSHNRVFEMVLRQNLKFADGTPITAKAVVASIHYFLKVGVNAKTWGSTITSVTATGPLTIQVSNSTPNPEMPFVFSQSSLAGLVISPAGLGHLGNLDQNTYGAGPYVLDQAQTVANSRYVFTPNPHYWNPADIHWKKVVALVIADPNSSVKALQAGQVDFVGSAVNLLPDIKAAGLSYYTAPAGVVGLILADRDGTVAPELKNQQVRQALNYAINRTAILKAIFAGYGAPTTELNSPGWEGYDPGANNQYPYDPAKAKQLLAAAGYPNGFTISMLAEQFIGEDVVAQAVAAQWKQIGVTVNLTDESQIPAAIGAAMTRQFPVIPLLALNSPEYLLASSFLLPAPNPGNPFATSDAQLSSLLGQAAATSDTATRNSLYQHAMAMIVNLAWFAPVVTIDGVFAADAKITGWKSPIFDITAIKPA